MKAGEATATKHPARPEIQDCDYVDLTPLSGPRFLVTVDTEEEFDWDKPFARENRSTEHVPTIERFQALCQAQSVKPIYLVDMPIVQDEASVALLGDYVQSGKADVGAQLHPWVTPPFKEKVNGHNSFACNLPYALEREKLLTLAEGITNNFGTAPKIYRAGRYGFGKNTPAILKEAGIAIDSSVRSRFDYSAFNGPDYTSSPVQPYWLDNGVMELPLTTLFSGFMPNVGGKLFASKFANGTSRSVLARSGMAERIALTPEGIPLEKAIKGIDRALEENVGILNFSFHSPSLQAGNTPYVKSESELEEFYLWWDGVFAHLTKRNVQSVALDEILAIPQN